MLSFLMSVKGEITIPDSIVIALVGLAIVFAILALLILLLYLFKYGFIAIEKIPFFKKEKTVESLQDNTVEVDDAEEIAAVTAAVMMMLAQEQVSVEGVAPSFKVKNIKRI